jgi:hypothetical protein
MMRTIDALMAQAKGELLCALPNHPVRSDIYPDDLNRGIK